MIELFPPIFASVLEFYLKIVLTAFVLGYLFYWLRYKK